MIWDEDTPRCPKCGSSDGLLGTEWAYFICRVCKVERYWTDDYQHPNDWEIAKEKSPWSKKKPIN